MHTAPEHTPGDRFVKYVGWVAIIAAVAVGGVFLFGFFARIAGNNPGGAFLLLAFVAGLGLVAYFFLPPRGRGDYEKPGRYMRLIVPTLVLFGLSAFGAFSGYSDRRDGWLYYYCAYGSVSQAQMDGCLDHVNKGDVDRLDTNAARFSRWELGACLADAGPYCAAALGNQRLKEANDSSP